MSDQTQIQQLLQEQNQALDELKRTTERLKEVATQIGCELDNQLIVINELKDDVDKNSQKLDQANQQVKHLKKKIGSRCSLM